MEWSDIIYEYNNTQPGFACVCVNQLTCFCMSNKTHTLKAGDVILTRVEVETH